jgi:hydroxymethylglutaryl-CoA lyase
MIRHSHQLNFVYNYLNAAPNIRYFDVTLRDGLQSLKYNYSLKEKQQLLNTIIKTKNPHSIEIGSIVSPKIIPQMKDSIHLYKYAKQHYKDIDTKFYMLIPNEKAYAKAIENDIKHISLLTSVSDSFQYENVNKTLIETKKEIKNILARFTGENIKLYISCINQCPIVGKIKTTTIIKEIIFYGQNKKINEICLSDTCGNLDFETYKTIIDFVLHFVDREKISLHLHISDKNIENTYNIINYSLLKDINNFDVSYIENIGGCHITLGDNLNGNITYEIIEDCINH